LVLKGGGKCLLFCSEDVTSILECGCNIGRNINFLNAALPSAKKSIIEIRQPAFEFVTKKHDLQSAFNGSIEESDLTGQFHLVFTNGVLIHIHPDNLLANMRKMFDYSSKCLLIGEDFNRTPIMLEYQGQQDRLFKRYFWQVIHGKLSCNPCGLWFPFGPYLRFSWVR